MKNETPDSTALKPCPIEALIPGGKLYNDFQPKRMKQISCNGGLVTYLHRGTLFCCEIAGGALTCLAQHSMEELKAALGEKFADDTTLHPIEGERGHFWLELDGEVIIADLLRLQVKKRIKTGKGWSALDYSAKAGCWAYTCRNGLHLLHTDGSTEEVYRNDNEAITAGQTAARDEFGITKGTFWNNGGTQLAFFITDQSQVAQYPLVDIEEPMAKARSIYYPMAGQPSEQTRLAIYTLATKKVVVAEKQGEPEDYICCVTFTPDDQHLLLEELNRKQVNARMKKLDAHTGKVKVKICATKNPRYIEPETTPLFVDDYHFVWHLPQNNHRLPYLQGLEGEHLRCLTNVEADVTRIAGYDHSTQRLVMEVAGGNAMGRQLLSADLEGNLTYLTPEGEQATHKATLLADGWLIDEVDSPETPYKAILRRTDGTQEVELINEPDPATEHALPQVELGTTKVGRYQLNYRLVKPLNHDPKKKYPLVCYVYGGPHVQLVKADWNRGTAGFEYMMASQGYYVFTIDPRGSANRGLKFEQEIWQDIGARQLEDYTAATKWLLKREKGIDADRIGVYGWSFGGFMAASLMLKQPELFKTGVAGGPVTDWKLYEVMYTERYMGTPEENPEGYANNDLKNFVKNLEGHLLLIHCNTDPVVLWQNSLGLLQQAVKDDKQIDYAVYVGYPHNVRGKDRVHLMKKVKRYFDEHLKN